MTKQIRFTSLGLVLTFLTIFPAAAAIQFVEGGYDAALAKAKTEKLLVLIDFYADWCGPCKTLDKVTWKDAQVSELAQQFVSVKIDAEKGEGPGLAARYGVEGFPTIVFLDETGKELSREVGFQPPANMLESMRKALGQAGGLAKRAAERPEDARLQLEAAKTAASSRKWDDARSAMRRARDLSASQDPAFQAEVLLLGGRLDAQQQSWKPAAEQFQKFLELAPDHRENQNARAELAQSLVRDGRPEEGLAAFRVLVAQKPDSISALNAFAWFCASEKIGLEEAIPVARKAVELSKRDPGILDTLAELHFVRGEVEEALKVINEAIELEPRDDYYRQQKLKFQGVVSKQEPGAP